MDRRIFITASVGGLALASWCAVGLPRAKPFRVGTLALVRTKSTSLGGVLGTALGKRGYVVGKDIVFEERSAEGNVDMLPSLAAELVRLNVDIIVAGPAVAIRAAHDATTTIPIVMAFSADDPVKSGFVADLAHPRGNVTGVTAQARELAPKWMELLRDAVPGLTRIAIITNPLRPEHAEYVKLLETRRPPGSQLYLAEVRGPEQFESAFIAMTKAHANGVIILGDVMFTRDSGRLAALAVTYRLPSIYLFREFVLAGGLMTYGPDEWELLDLAAEYVDKILNGANPGDLPVQRPTQFHLAINLKTARILGLTIPRLLALRADELVE